MRLAISSADMPPYCHTAVMTGMLMLGKMSVGVRRIAIGPTKRMTTARTMKVYGRLSATRTIHMTGSAHYSDLKKVSAALHGGVGELTAKRDRIDGRHF